MRRGLCALALMLLGLTARAAELTVSAASTLGNAFAELAPLFEAAHPGARVRYNFGASGALLQQIARGAPVDVFASADPQTMDQAQRRRLIDADRRVDFAANTLVVIVPAASPVAPRLLADLAQGAYARVAIGLPESVAAGRYAKGALERAGVWAALQPRVIGASSVRQALDYVARGEVDAGFVFATDAALMAGKVKVALTVPVAGPILHVAAPLPQGPNAAMGQRFVRFLREPAAQAVLARHGFGRP